MIARQYGSHQHQPSTGMPHMVMQQLLPGPYAALPACARSFEGAHLRGAAVPTSAGFTGAGATFMPAQPQLTAQQLQAIERERQVRSQLLLRQAELLRRRQECLSQGLPAGSRGTRPRPAPRARARVCVWVRASVCARVMSCRVVSCRVVGG
jgi:hypothetical protein